MVWATFGNHAISKNMSVSNSLRNLTLYVEFSSVCEMGRREIMDKQLNRWDDIDAL